MNATQAAKLGFQTLRGVAIVYLTLIAIAAPLISLAEGWAFLDALWWTFVTATTVGYGDMSPATGLGRIIAVVVMHLGPGFIFPLATAIIASKLIVDQDAFTHEEQELLKSNQTRIVELLEGLNKGAQTPGQNERK